MIHPAETTRDRLLDAAESLFGDLGYDAVGIRQIADRAGVNLSGIKYHFGSKRGLYLETVRRSMDQSGSTDAWAILDQTPDSPTEAAAALHAFIHAFLRVLLAQDRDACGCLVMQSAAQPDDATDLVVREFIRPHLERLDHLIAVLCPKATEHQRARYAHSVMALLMYQRMFRPFLDRMGDRLADDQGNTSDHALRVLAQELAQFALRAMGRDELTSPITPAEDTSRAGATQ